MKNTPIITLLLLLLLPAFAMAQPRGKVKGTAKEGATILLLKATDSAVVKMAVAGSGGQFEIEQLSWGNYLLQIHAVGFEAYISNKFSLNDAAPTYDAGILKLQPLSNELNNVTVTARKQMVEVQADKTVVNVDAMISNTGATALEVLEKSPGISVDRDGNISMRGKQGVMVLIDGKPSYLTGADLVNLLSSMTANQLDQIELMTNPPAKYDAAGNAGIINIKTKKSRQRGWNGNLNLSYGQGKYEKLNNSLNLNYRNEKLNVYLNYSQRHFKDFNNLLINRTYYDATGKDVQGYFEQPTYLLITGNHNNLKAGVDLYLSKQTTLGFSASGFISPRNFDGESIGHLKGADAAIDSSTFTFSDNGNRWQNAAFNINLRHSFSKNSELSADVDYNRYDMANNQLFTTQIVQPLGQVTFNELLKGNLPSVIDIYAAKADYSYTTSKGLKLETGWKSSYVRTDNTADYFLWANSNWKPDYDKTNHFEYKENINAAYINSNKSFGKLSVQAGLRFENTNYKGYQRGNPQKADSSFTNNYNKLFPTVYLSYPLDSNNTVNLNVGRRIDRPAYQQMNPFLFFINKYTYQVGNPFIQPQLTTTFELTHTYKNWLTTTINHSETNKYFSQIFRTEGEVTILTQGNLARMRNTSLSINAQLNPTKWWSANVSGTLNKRVVKGVGNNSDFASDNVSFSANANNNFKLGKGWSAELSGNYNSRSADAQFIIAGFGQVSAGIAKQVLKNKGSVKLNVRDIFFSQIINGDIRYQNVREHFKQSRDSRVVTLSFSYRFGKNFNDNRRKTGGSSEEQQRVGVGG